MAIGMFNWATTAVSAKIGSCCGASLDMGASPQFCSVVAEPGRRRRAGTLPRIRQWSAGSGCSARPGDPRESERLHAPPSPADFGQTVLALCSRLVGSGRATAGANGANESRRPRSPQQPDVARQVYGSGATRGSGPLLSAASQLGVMPGAPDFGIRVRRATAQWLPVLAWRLFAGDLTVLALSGGTFDPDVNS